MGRHYSTRDFFRQMPKGLLGRYFAAQSVLAELDFAMMKDGDPQALFDAWQALPEDSRRRMEADFGEIAELSDPAGLVAILDEAKFHLQDRPGGLAGVREALAALPDHHSRAMVTFLDHPEMWRGALYFHHADKLTWWRKRKNLPRRPAAVDKASLELLAEKIKAHFRATDGRGRNCVVEPYRRGERDYFFAFPEDHAQRHVEWVEGGRFELRPHNPAFEIVYVYCQTEGTLELNARGLGQSVETLQAIFAQAILKMDSLPPDPRDERVYDLGPLVRREFAFVTEAGSGIGAVVLKRVRLASRVRRGDRLTIEADPSQNRMAVHELMEEVGKSVPLHLYNVTQVDVEATVLVADGKAKRKAIRITHPNMCSLKQEDMDLKLRQMLVASGIEPRAPAAETAAHAVGTAG